MTSISSSRKLATLIAGAALALTAAPAAAVPDYGSSGARDTGGSSSKVDQTPAAVQDLRSPDARDAANTSSPKVEQTTAVLRDLRSPDTRDVATGYRPAPVATVDAESVPNTHGFDWASAAIGVAAAGGLAILLLGLVGFRRHQPSRVHPA